MLSEKPLVLNAVADVVGSPAANNNGNNSAAHLDINTIIFFPRFEMMQLQYKSEVVSTVYDMYDTECLFCVLFIHISNMRSAAAKILLFSLESVSQPRTCSVLIFLLLQQYVFKLEDKLQ